MAGLRGEPQAPGNSTDIESMYQDFGYLVHRRCERLLGDEQEAMDVTQWAFVRAIEVGFELRTPGQALRWLYDTASRRCLDLLRKRTTRGRLRLVHAEELAGTGPRSAETRTLQRDLVLRVLGRLDDRTARIVLLTRVDELPSHRAAEVVGVSVRTVARAKAEFDQLVKDFANHERESPPPGEGSSS